MRALLPPAVRYVSPSCACPVGWMDGSKAPGRPGCVVGCAATGVKPGGGGGMSLSWRRKPGGGGGTLLTSTAPKPCRSTLPCCRARQQQSEERRRVALKPGWSFRRCRTSHRHGDRDSIDRQPPVQTVRACRLSPASPAAEPRPPKASAAELWPLAPSCADARHD